MMSCDDPPYLIDFDRDDSTPRNISSLIFDAFTIKVDFSVVGLDGIDSAVVYRASSQDNTASIDTLSFKSIGNATVNTTDSLTFLDTAATYGYWNYYTILTWSKNISSLLSDTLSIYFKIPSPRCSLQTNKTGLLQTISAENNYLTGIKIFRESTSDTSIKVFEITSDSVQVFQDTLSINYDNPVQNYSSGSVFHYNDISPNLSFTYEIQTFQEKNGKKRFSSTFRDSIIFEAIIPEISSEAISDSLIRVYLSNTDSVLYDSFYVFGYSNSVWEIQKKGKLVDLVHYQQNSLIDVNQSQSICSKILIKNENYYTFSDSILISPLAISGFRLVEGGTFSWGCKEEIDTHCDTVEYPAQDIDINGFYMSVYEVTESAYNDVTNWPPVKGDIPVDNISLSNASQFCNNMDLEYPQFDFFIPNEQEWEYAAKYNIASQSGTIYPWSNVVDLFNANYGFQNPGSVGVGSYSYQSHFGIADMAGNVLEWTNNCFTNTLQDSVFYNDDCWVVAKGGGFWHGANGIRTTSRYNLPQNTEAVGVGLRIAMRPN